MKRNGLFGIVVGLLASLATVAAEDDREFFDGLVARNVGPFRGGRATVAVGVNQDAHVYYMGTTGGVWKTSNAGASWQVISDTDFGSAAVGAIAVAPSDPNVVVVGMGESPFRNIASSQGDGVYKSTDAGETWERVGFEDVKQIGEIRIHPEDPDTIWVAAQGNAYESRDDNGVYKSTDGGETWRRVLVPINATTGAVDLALDMNNPRVLYAAMWDNLRTPWNLRSGGPGSGIWRSTDGGDSWERLSEGLPSGMGKIGVAASPAQSDLVWAIVEAEGDEGGLYRSADGGDSWSQVNSERVLRARSWYYMHIFADPNDADTVYVLNAPFMKSVDGGKTFTPIEVPHGDNHYLWINPNNSQWMVNANDGGANVSFDGGQSWSRQDNQPTAQFYRVNTDNQFEYRIYGGQQDNSTVAIRSRSRDGSIGRDDWEIHGGCESAHVAFDANNPRFTYAGCYLGLIEEFDTETRTARSIKAYEELGLGVPASEQRLRFNWNAPIHVSQHDSSVIYHAANVLLRSEDRGFNWTAVSPDLTRDEEDKQGLGAGPYTNENIEVYNTIFALEESPHDPETLWVGTDDGRVHVTRNGGREWLDVTPRGVGRGLINAIDASPHEPGTAYVVAMKYKEGDNRPYVYKTTDYGRRWSNIAGGLPTSHFVRVVREDTERAGLLFAGMERGLFVSLDGGDNWRALQTNLPIVPITDLMVRRDDLVLATQGRAFWVVDDISPLRQHSDEHERSLHLYAPSQAVRLTPTKGRNGGGESFAPSAPDGALIYYSLPSAIDVDEGPEFVIEILNAEGATVRTLRTSAEAGTDGGGPGTTYALPAHQGLNRAVWDLRWEPMAEVDYPFLVGAGRDETRVAGHRVEPGVYRVRATLGDEVLEQDLEVEWDPVLEYDPTQLRNQQQMLTSLYNMLDGLYRRIASLQSVSEQLRLRRDVATEAGDESLAAIADSLLAALEEWQTSVSTPARTNGQDVLHFAPRLDAFLTNLYQQVDDAVLGVTDGQEQRYRDLRVEWNTAVASWNALMEDRVYPYSETEGPAILIPEWR